MGTDADGLYWDGNPAYHRLLRYTNQMMQGEDVRWVQRALIAIGYYLGPWGPSSRGDDGIFGSKTNANVRSYQGSHRDIYNRVLAVDGIVGPLTWGALSGASVGVASSASPAPKPAPKPRPAPRPTPAPSPSPAPNNPSPTNPVIKQPTPRVFPNTAESDFYMTDFLGPYTGELRWVTNMSLRTAVTWVFFRKNF